MRMVWLVSSLVFAFGCDVGYGGFLGAVPVEETHSGKPVQVVLAIDGMSRAAFDRARASGAFRDYATADLVTFFPGVSDYSWMRILHAGKMPGYEIEYYDPVHDELRNAGVGGVLQHPLREGVASPLPSYRRFDFLGDGDFWMLQGYSDPEAALPSTLDALFFTLAARGRQQDTFLAYLLNVDVVSHHGSIDRAARMLVEIDRRIREFKDRHPGRFTFTLVADHGNAHQKAELVDPRELLRQTGIEPVEKLGGTTGLVAIPIVHVRVNYVALHTRSDQAIEVATRVSRHAWVDLTVTRLTPTGDLPRFGLFRKGALFAFGRHTDGSLEIEDAPAWSALGIDLRAHTDAAGVARLGDADALAVTAGSSYPDLFHRVASAFATEVVQFPADVLVSFRDDVASFGFHLPGTDDALSVDGFHGALSRNSSLSVVATETRALPPVIRADDLAALFPALAPRP